MTVGHVEAETLLNTIQYSLPEVEAQTTVDALRDMDAKASVNKLADRVAEANADKVGGETDGCDQRITSLNAGRFSRRGEGQDGWQNTRRRGG